MNDYKNNYPSILVHGFAGWGEEDGMSKYFNYWGMFGSRRLIPHLRGEGYEVYYPSLGPF